MSPVGASLAARQVAAVRAAADAGVARIVKLSGSAWTMQPGRMTSSGAAHAEVEAAIKASAMPHVFLRPNAFMQTMLARLPGELASADHFSLAIGAAQVSLIDVRDIAAVAAQALTGAQVDGEVLELSGPQAWSGSEIAAAATRLTGARSTTAHYRQRPRLPPWRPAASRPICNSTCAKCWREWRRARRLASPPPSSRCAADRRGGLKRGLAIRSRRWLADTRPIARQAPAAGVHQLLKRSGAR